MAGNFPTTNMVGNYSICEGLTESSGANGAEASVTWIGEWDQRFNFLNQWFGNWTISQDSTPVDPMDPDNTAVQNTCCATLVNVPCPYTTVLATASCLYPDTFTLRQRGELSLFGAAAALDKIKPVTGCAAEITINFRFKWHSQWPAEFHPGCLCTRGDQTGQRHPLEAYVKQFPDIPAGTFIAVDKRVDVENLKVPANDIRLEPMNNFQEVAGSDCAKRLVNEAGDFNNAPQIKQVTEEVQFGIPITVTTWEVTWSNVPIVPHAAIDQLRGKVSSSYFMNQPRWSTLFAGAEIRPKGTFECQQISDVIYTFITKTVDFPCADNLEDAGGDSISDAVGAACGKIGVWNRNWERCPTSLDGTSGTSTCCSHIRDVLFQIGCGGSTTLFPQTTEIDDGDNTFSDSFSQLFELVCIQP